MGARTGINGQSASLWPAWDGPSRWGRERKDWDLGNVKPYTGGIFGNGEKISLRHGTDSFSRNGRIVGFCNVPTTVGHSGGTGQTRQTAHDLSAMIDHDVHRCQALSLTVMVAAADVNGGASVGYG